MPHYKLNIVPCSYHSCPGLPRPDQHWRKLDEKLLGQTLGSERAERLYSIVFRQADGIQFKSPEFLHSDALKDRQPTPSV